jgi:hypothetical protein
MDDYIDRYSNRFVKLVDCRATMKEFDFNQTLMMPTAGGYRALVEQAKIEINPRIMKYLSKRWSQATIENLSFFAMAAAIYARSIADPPYSIDVGKVLLKTAALCYKRCARRKSTGGGCMAAMNKGYHQLPRCVKMPRDIETAWENLKIYIATGKALEAEEAAIVHEKMRVKVNLPSDYSPDTSC